MKEDQITKSSFEESAITFKNDILLNENRINFLKDLGTKNKFNTKKALRPIAWRIFLETIPSVKNDGDIIKEWIDIIFE